MGEGRPGRPKLSDAGWIALLEAYVRGAAASELAAAHGVSVWAIYWQARNRGYRKCDRPGAVYRWRQPPPVTPAQDAGALAFDFDPDDLDGSAARAMEGAKAAAAEGRLADYERLMAAAATALRVAQMIDRLRLRAEGG